MEKDVKKEIRCIIENVFQKIKYGSISSVWDVYDEFNTQLQKMINKM